MRLESCARADRRRTRPVPAASTSPTGEHMRTEISAKFREATVARELAAAGLHLAHWWTDDAGDFALSLALA